MFVSSTDYQAVVTSIAEEDGELLVAVSFWGRGAEAIVHPRTTGPVTIICNLKSGATNPDTIAALMNKSGLTLKQHDRLHAKVLVGSKTALVGSANFSCNGLNLEGVELQGWAEAGLLTRDAEQLDAIRKWFHARLSESRKISDQDIEDARVQWALRRNTRIQTSGSRGSFVFSDFAPTDLLDRDVYLAIYTNHLSEDAKTAYRQKEAELTGEPVSPSSKLPPIYENWSELSKKGQLIDLYYGPRGGLACHGAFTPRYDFDFQYSDGSEGHLTVCRKDKLVLERHFRAQEASQLAKSLQPHIEAIWDSPLAVGEDGGKLIRLADAVQICSEHSA